MYKQVNDFILKNINLELQLFNYITLDSKWKYKNVNSSFNRLYIPVSGEGEIEYDGKIVKLVPGKAYIIPNSFLFSYNCSDFLEKFYIHFKLLLPNGLDVFFGLSQCLDIDIEPSVIIQISDCMINNDINSAIKLNMILYEIINAAVSKYNILLDKIDNSPEILNKIVNYVNNNLLSTLTLDDVCKQFYISRSTLKKLFNKHIKLPFSKYLDYKILAETEQLLLYTNKSINEISEKFNFCDQFYFSRKFKQFYKVSPSQYRQRHI